MARARSTQRAVGRHVVDGDTFDVFIDLGFYQYSYETIRLRGIDTPEIYRPDNDLELEHAREAKDRVEELVLNEPLLLRSFKPGADDGYFDTSFGRFIADVFIPFHDNFDVQPRLVFTPDQRWASLAELLMNEGFQEKESYGEEN